jgi:hypothetical protein
MMKYLMVYTRQDMYIGRKCMHACRIVWGENSWTMSAWKPGNKMEIIRRDRRRMELSSSRPWF